LTLGPRTSETSIQKRKKAAPKEDSKRGEITKEKTDELISVVPANLRLFPFQ